MPPVSALPWPAPDLHVPLAAAPAETPVVARRWLAVCYLFAPIARMGTMRSLAFVRELDRLGWRSTVVSTSERRIHPIDAGLSRQVPECTALCTVGRPDLFRRYEALKSWRQRFTTPKHTSPAEPGPAPSALSYRGLLDRLSWLAALPDKQIDWAPAALVRTLHRIRIDRPDVLYSSGPPHTAHLVAAAAARLTGLPWVADFRDPWVDNPFADLPPRPASRNERLERWAIERADRVVCNTEPIREAFLRRYDRPSRFVTLTNGYTERDFLGLPPWQPRAGRVRLVYAGTIYGRRDPEPLWRALGELRRHWPMLLEGFELELIGIEEGRERFERLASELGIAERIRFVDPMPRQDVLRRLSTADLLLLLGPRGDDREMQVPGKLYEYLGARRPVLSLSKPGGAIEDVLLRGGLTHWLADPDSVPAIRSRLVTVLTEARSPERLAIDLDSLDTRAFEHASLSERLTEIFEDAIRERPRR